MEIKIRKLGMQNQDYLHLIYLTTATTELVLSDFGARICHWYIFNQPVKEDVIVGTSDLEMMTKVFKNHGAIIGRIAGRVERGKIETPFIQLQLECNNGTFHAHGGNQAMNLQKWKFKLEKNINVLSVTFTLFDQAGKNGYAGNVDIHVTYTLTKFNQLIINYEINTDEKTIVNPTNHVYFNLNGNPRDSIHNHYLRIDLDAYVTLRDDKIPIYPAISSKGTDFDFLHFKRLGKILTYSMNEQIIKLKGFDHPFVLNR